VYKEKALGEVEIDVIYLNGWVAVFQFLLSIPLLFPSAPASALAIDQIPNNLWAGTKCFVGIDTVMSGSNKDDCAMSPIYVSIYLVRASMAASFIVMFPLVLTLVCPFTVYHRCSTWRTTSSLL
jgi:hypothetical protein